MLSRLPVGTEPDVVYVLFDKLGGVFNFCANLLAYRRGPMRCGAVLTYSTADRDVRAKEPLPADWQVTLGRSPNENLYAPLRRVHRAIQGRGALVANDWIELAAVAAFPTDRTVFSICHMDSPYYYDLAVRHEPDIDVYLTYTEFLRDRLIELLPHRRESIVLRRYGVEIRGHRTPTAGPLRLLYVGRVDRGKGVFDLPEIDAILQRLGVPVVWTVQGTGPDFDELRASWSNPAVQWRGRRPMSEVLAEYERQDVLVMPSRHEGLPVALLEAGAAGVVPVVSDLPTGIPEVVHNGATGYRLPVGDVQGFADAIVGLARDRVRLEQLSGALRTLVRRDWDIAVNAAGYETLFDRWAELRRPRGSRRPLPYGSRLDRRWLPNPIVKAIRGLRGPVDLA